MAQQVHELLPIKANTNNYPLYRFEGDCTCGFATKLQSRQAVEDQLKSHLQAHGINVVTFADTEAEKARKAANLKAGVTSDGWKPEGLKVANSSDWKPTGLKPPIVGPVPVVKVPEPTKSTWKPSGVK
jgi:hypothetical protein